MKRLRVSLLFAIVAMSLLVACQLQRNDVEAREVWARPGVKDGNGAVYMVLHNHSGQSDDLVGASTEVAQTAELHKSEVDDQGVMVMLKQDSVPLPANSEVLMQPGGYHIMLIGLKRDLKEGDTFQVVLKFRSHSDLLLSVTVRGDGMETQPQGGSNSHSHPASSPTP